MDNLVEIYCDVDDFMKKFLPTWHEKLITNQEKKKRIKPSRLTMSEVVTLLILFHSLHYRTLKHFYSHYVCLHLREAFPDLVSYSQFVRLQQLALIPLCHYLLSRCGNVTGISYVDSTSISVCHPKRMDRNKVFQGVAKKSKTSMGWFFGFKLHLVVNECGDLLSFCLTPGNVDDRKLLKKLTKNLTGKLFDDRGYVSNAKTAELLEDGIQLITTLRKNMKNQLLGVFDQILLRKRLIIETINDQLKNLSQIEHSRHRSIINFVVNLLAGLAAYTHQAKKPSINLTPAQTEKFNQALLTCN